jgi:hypothetical protein
MSETEQKPTVKFYYQKSRQFRVVHSDGVYGGATPNGHLCLSFFSERFPIPQVLEHEIEEDGKIGRETGKEMKEGIVREVEVAIVVPQPIAIALRDWLNARIAGFAEAQKGQTE